MRWINTIWRWALAVIVTVVAASAVHSWTIQQGLIGLGVTIPQDLRLNTAVADFQGLAPALLVVFGAALAIGFVIAAVLQPRLQIAAILAWPIAGAAAIAVTLLIMRWQMAITPIASAREPLGFALLAASGALGGLAFAATRRH